MKKSTSTLFAILIAMFIWLLPTTVNSQTVINTPLFASFEDGTVNPFDWHLDTMTGSFQIENNPVKTGINTTDKCLKFTCTTGGAGWWGKLFMTTNSSYTIQQNTTSHRYLHFFAYTTSATKTAEIQLKDAAGNVIIKPQYTLSQANVWEEVIIDLGVSFTGTIGEIYIAPCLDWGGGLSTGDVYMVDQFSLSDIEGTYYNNPILSTFENDFTSPFDYTIDGGNISTGVNTTTDGINNSSNCLYGDYPAGSDWWHKVKLEAKSTMVIVPATANHKYLHFLCMRDIPNEVYIEIQNKAGVQIYVKHFTPSLINAWEEIVLDLSQSENSLAGIVGQNLGKIWIYPSAGGGPVSHNKFDQFVLSDTKDPIGNLKVVNNVANFDGTSFIAKINLQNGNSTATVVANPLPTDTYNSTANALKYDVTVAGDWWQSLQLFMNGYMKVGNPDSYLHFMMYNPGGSNFTVVLTNVQGEEKAVDFTVSNSTSWQDYIINLDSLSLTNVNGINFRIPTVNAYYIDEIVVNSTSVSRTPGTVTGTKITNEDVVNIYSSNGNAYISAHNLKSVNVFSTNGVLVAQRSVINLQTVQIELKKGIYIVKTVLTDGTEYSSKVKL